MYRSTGFFIHCLCSYVLSSTPADAPSSSSPLLFPVSLPPFPFLTLIPFTSPLLSPFHFSFIHSSLLTFHPSLWFSLSLHFSIHSLSLPSSRLSSPFPVLTFNLSYSCSSSFLLIFSFLHFSPIPFFFSLLLCLFHTLVSFSLYTPSLLTFPYFNHLPYLHYLLPPLP